MKGRPEEYREALKIKGLRFNRGKQNKQGMIMKKESTE